LSLEAHAYDKLLPALNETIERYKHQGCRMGGKSEVAEYLTSLGYNYATVRKWNERLRNRLLEAAAPTKPAPTDPLTPAQQEVVQALIEQGYKKGEAIVLAKAATGMTFTERFKSALASRVVPAITATESKGGTSFEEVPADHKFSQPPTIIATPAAEAAASVTEEFRQRLNSMADTAEIEDALNTYLTELVLPLLNTHAYRPTLEITINVGRECHRRIAEGDWVEYRGGSNRLTTQIGREKSLGKVVGVNKADHPRIRWYDGTGWKKPYSFFPDWSSEDSPFADSEVRVLFEHQATDLFPEALHSYSDDYTGKKAPRPPLVAVEETDESQSSTASGTARYSISEYYGEFAIWIEPRKREDTPFNTLPTREEAEAQVAILSAGGSIGGTEPKTSAPKKSPSSVKVPLTPSVAVNDDTAAMKANVMVDSVFRKCGWVKDDDD